MGGRGGKSGIALSVAQERKLEDAAQFKSAKRYGYVAGAKRVEYTDSTGKIRKADTGRATGGTYRTSYSEEVAKYAKMSTKKLNEELSKQRAISDNNYQQFARSAASRSASQVSNFASADKKIRMIKQVLARKKVM
jgi:hypothetical protein